MIWFTSDTHLGHANAIGFTNRPFDNIEAMNRTLIANINACVQARDELYILGDFSFRIPAEDAARLRGKIRCRNVHLVPGNHDKDWSQPDVAGTFVVEPPIKVLKAEGRKFVLSHYPIMDWQSMRHGSIQLHGHIHTVGGAYNQANRARGLLRYDVGVDANGMMPVSMAQALQWFEGVDPCGRPEREDLVLYLMNSQGRLLGKNLGFLYPAFLSDGTGMRNSCHLRLFWATRGAD